MDERDPSQEEIKRQKRKAETDNTNSFQMQTKSPELVGLKEGVKESSKNGKTANEADLFECPLCQQLLYEPITTSCGHTFCRSCILRAMDHDNKCPLCRTTVHISPEYGVAILLQQLIQKNFPSLYQIRRDEIHKELKDQTYNLPLFLLGELILFPKMALPLHIHEPKYRLMIRRCLDGGRRFGVVPSINGEMAKTGTVAVIENHYIFPDGRSLVATLGETRFKVLDWTDVDGYRVAKIEYLNDCTIESEKVESIDNMFHKAKEVVLEKLKDVKADIEQKFGKMPSSSAFDFSWWLSAVLPLDTTTKLKLLEMQVLDKRLEVLLGYLTKMESGSCTLS